MSRFVGTDVFVLEDSVLVFSQNDDAPVACQNLSDLYIIMLLWGFEQSEISMMLKHFRTEGHNYANFGIGDGFIFTSYKSPDEILEKLEDHGKRSMVS